MSACGSMRASSPSHRPCVRASHATVVPPAAPWLPSRPTSAPSDSDEGTQQARARWNLGCERNAKGVPRTLRNTATPVNVNRGSLVDNPVSE
jgi:hypothetical protein